MRVARPTWLLWKEDVLSTGGQNVLFSEREKVFGP